MEMGKFSCYIHCKNLILIGPVPVVKTNVYRYFPFNNRPYTVPCTVTFSAAVPLETVIIQWTTPDGILLTDLSDRIKVSQIRQINESIFARDAIFNPLRLEDNGTYMCGAGLKKRFPISRPAYELAHISVISKHLAVSYNYNTYYQECMYSLISIPQCMSQHL